MDGFAQLFRDEYPRVVALIATLVGDRALAEDVTQNAFSKAHQRWDRVSEYQRPGAWIRRVAINEALSWRRSRAREERMLVRLATGGHEHTPEETDIWRAVAALPGQQRAAVALFYVEDRTTAEIAEILGCSEATARVHLHRGRKALATSLGEVDG